MTTRFLHLTGLKFLAHNQNGIATVHTRIAGVQGFHARLPCTGGAALASRAIPA